MASSSPSSSLFPVCRRSKVKVCCAVEGTSTRKAGLLAFCLEAGTFCVYDRWEPVYPGSPPVKWQLSRSHSSNTDSHSGTRVSVLPATLTEAKWIYGVLEAAGVPWSKVETFLGFSFWFFFSCAQFWACSWLSGFRAVLPLPISRGLCHLQMIQVCLKRMVLRKAGFLIECWLPLHFLREWLPGTQLGLLERWTLSFLPEDSVCCKLVLRCYFSQSIIKEPVNQNAFMYSGTDLGIWETSGNKAEKLPAFVVITFYWPRGQRWYTVFLEK